MRHLSFKYYRCDDLLQKFGESELSSWFAKLYDEITAFISMNDLSNKVVISKGLLINVIIDYFNDILRLKNFHTDIEQPNTIKVTAYTSYWLLYRKPIQITSDASIEDKELATVNERFVLQFILNYLSDRERGSHILSRTNKGLKNFSGLLLYWLVYRVHDAQSIEMIVSAFLAGQIYENTDEDISEKLHPFDSK